MVGSALKRCAALALGIVAVGAEDPQSIHKGLLADDECRLGAAGCALEALQVHKFAEGPNETDENAQGSTDFGSPGGWSTATWTNRSMDNESYADDTLGAMLGGPWKYWHGKWHYVGHHHHHYHHHHYQPPPHHAPAPPPSGGHGNVMTLFHQTSMGICKLIQQNGFRPGSAGWCGGAIYFATSPQATETKAIGTHSHLGCMVTAKVDVGRVKVLGKQCGGHGNARSGGADCLRFNPGDGDEFVIWDARRVKSVSIAPYKSSRR